MYTKVFLSFEKFSIFESWILKLCCVVCFEDSKDVFASFDQVTKSLSTLFYSKIFLMFLTLFNNFVPPLYLVDNLVLECLTGQARVIVWTMNAMVPSVFGNFA